MIKSDFLQDLSIKIKNLVSNSPISDLDRNIHALIQGAFTKMELVSREEYDVQVQALQHAQQKLISLEAKLAALEDLLQKGQK